MRFENSLESSPATHLRMDTHDIFATRIWQARLKAVLPPLEHYAKAIEARRIAQPEPAGRTNRQGWNSLDMDILDQADFTAIAGAVRRATDLALAEMGCHGLAFDLQSWINVHDKGGFNFLHVHEGSYLSGTFYVRVPPGAGGLMFRDPRPGVIHGALKGAAANGYRDIRLQPEDGLLVLFPCWLEHFVEPHAGEASRMAIAFNAVQVGQSEVKLRRMR